MWKHLPACDKLQDHVQVGIVLKMKTQLCNHKTYSGVGTTPYLNLTDSHTQQMAKVLQLEVYCFMLRETENWCKLRKYKKHWAMAEFMV